MIFPTIRQISLWLFIGSPVTRRRTDNRAKYRELKRFKKMNVYLEQSKKKKKNPSL